mgnify:CR=1 FL=1
MTHPVAIAPKMETKQAQDDVMCMIPTTIPSASYEPHQVRVFPAISSVYWPVFDNCMNPINKIVKIIAVTLQINSVTVRFPQNFGTTTIVLILLIIKHDFLFITNVM